MLKRLVEHVVSHLVTKPEDVRVTQEVQEHKIVVSISVAQDDLKRVIGKEGRTIKSIRSMARAATPAEYELILDIAQ